MEPRKLIILLLHIGMCLASHYSHTIPVEGYETELHNLGEHVEIPETPVKVIKITKTVAVKIPVPYPVKVVEKVPYPVHINKPYPVPVPQIIKVPHVVTAKTPHEHHALNFGERDSNTYQVQENIAHNDLPGSYEQDGHSYNGPAYNSYNPPIAEENVEDYNHPQNYYYASNGINSPESKSNNDATHSYGNNYLNNDEKNIGFNNNYYH